MKKIFYFAFACALALGGASCSDNSSSEVNEWSAIYVGIERPKLGVSTLTLNINHPTAEVEAKASVPVTVKLSRPATQDITATLAMESDCEEAWTFETLEVVIPAGQITATTTLNGDWSYATDVVSSQTWTTKITVAAATPSNITRLSTNQNELTIVVNKEPVDLKNVSLETPSGNELTNRSSWTVTCNGAETDTLPDGDESSYMYDLHEQRRQQLVAPGQRHRASCSRRLRLLVHQVRYVPLPENLCDGAELPLQRNLHLRRVEVDSTQKERRFT